MNHGVAVLLEVEALLTDGVEASTNGQKGGVLLVNTRNEDYWW